MTATAAAGSRLDGAHLSTLHVVRSEWIKLRTLRSTWWCGAIIVVLSVLFGLLISGFINRDGTTLPTSAQDAYLVGVVTAGTTFTQLIAAVLGVLVISGEYGTGMIRSTFAAVPSRLPALLAKLAVLVVMMFVLGLIAVALTLAATVGILAGHGVDAHLGDSAVWMPILGSAVYLALVSGLAFSIGALVRNTAGGISAAIGLLLVLPILLAVAIGLTQAAWLANVNAVLPSAAGGQLYAYASPSGAAAVTGPGGRRAAQLTADVVLNGWGGLGVLAAWILAALVPALVLVRRRDA
ncbi:MAG TPA: ABC transporter permease [Amnibacterium sp.]|jgi:ABC-2 type transport system permease protein|uniref:ABC transporter permease n=1 Tax=Amnibacterium sp. TaxID=1872496 RepID=UPI002F9364BD